VEAPLGGGQPFVLASSGSGATGIAARAGTVYWTTTNITSGALMKIDLEGGSPVELATAVAPQGPCVTVNDEYVFWTDFGADVTTGTINATPVNGGATRVLASGQELPMGIAVDSDHVYWANGG